MTGKDLVYKALKHVETENVPKYIWYHPEVKNKLAKKLNIEISNIEIQLGNDILQDWLSINKQQSCDIPLNQTYLDEWGIKWKKQGHYNMIIENPLEKANTNEIINYKLPDPYKKNRYTELENLIFKFGDDKFIGADVSGSIFEPACHLRGMENLLLDMASGSKKADILLDKITEFTGIVAIESLKRGSHWVWLGDDVGTQRNMIISPRMWRKYLKPRLKKIINMIRSYDSTSYIAYHSCGSMYQIIGDLIDIKINALNPIQPKAKGMDAKKIKKEFGNDLTLICGLDTQEFLLNSTPPEVKERTKKLISELGSGGGYIFAASHTIQPDVPINNILAMLEVFNCN